MQSSRIFLSDSVICLRYPSHQSAIHGTNVTNYLLDLQAGLTRVLSKTVGANTSRYVHSPMGIHSAYDGTDWVDMLQDGLGSVRSQVDAMGQISANQLYDPYGQVIDEDGTWVGSFAYAGEQTDESGLGYNRARYYNPAMGAFASLDPFEGIEDIPMSLNGYSYVHGNPVNWTDPSGELCFVPLAGWIACGAAAVFYAALAAGVAVSIWWATTGQYQFSKWICDTFNQGLCSGTGTATNTGTEVETGTGTGTVVTDEDRELAESVDEYIESFNKPKPQTTVFPYPVTVEPPQPTPTSTPEDECTYEKIKRRIGAKSVAQVVGDVGNIRSGEPAYFKGAPPDGLIPNQSPPKKGVIGKAMDICRTGQSDQDSRHYICAEGVDCQGYRILVDGNGTLVARRVMGVEPEVRSGDPGNPFHILEDQDDANYYLHSDFNWENIEWED